MIPKSIANKLNQLFIAKATAIDYALAHKHKHTERQTHGQNKWPLEKQLNAFEFF